MSDKITTCLWFDGHAEEAANFYAANIPNSSVGRISRSPSDYPNGKAGDVITVEFTVAGQNFVGLNGGPNFKFNMAVSFQIHTDTQEETDRIADALTTDPESEQCSWVKDKFGLSWQIVPRVLTKYITGSDAGAAKRAFDAMCQMKRINIAEIEAAVARI